MARKAIIKKQSRLFDDFFKIDEIIVSHEQIDGSMSADQRRLVFERGDAVAVLLLNRDRKSVVLVEQFKLPTIPGRQRDDPTTVDGWILETAAGMIDEKETPEAAIVRETREETGYQIPQSEADQPVLFIAGRHLRAHISLFRRSARLRPVGEGRRSR